MNIILWLILGALAGWLASMIMGTDNSQGFLMDVIMGVVGAMLGGFIFNLFGAAGVTGFNIYSVVVAVIGAVIVTWIARKLRAS